MAHLCRKLGLFYVFLLTISFDLPSAAKDAIQNEKQEKARQIIAEGKALESQGKLLEAKEKYNQANIVWPGKDAANALNALNVAIKKKVAPLVEESSKLYAAGKYQESIGKLEAASALLPNDPLILYNFAASYYKLEDRRKALEYLDRCEKSMGARSLSE